MPAFDDALMGLFHDLIGLFFVVPTVSQKGLGSLNAYNVRAVKDLLSKGCRGRCLTGWTEDDRHECPGFPIREKFTGDQGYRLLDLILITDRAADLRQTRGDGV